MCAAPESVHHRFILRWIFQKYNNKLFLEDRKWMMCEWKLFKAERFVFFFKCIKSRFLEKGCFCELPIPLYEWELYTVVPSSVAFPSPWWRFTFSYPCVLHLESVSSHFDVFRFLFSFFFCLQKLRIWLLWTYFLWSSGNVCHNEML